VGCRKGRESGGRGNPQNTKNYGGKRGRFDEGKFFLANKKDYLITGGKVRGMDVEGGARGQGREVKLGEGGCGLEGGWCTEAKAKRKTVLRKGGDGGGTKVLTQP